MKLIIKIPGDFRTDMVSDEEIRSFLQTKLAEKYPQGEIEATRHFIGEGIDFQIRPTGAAVGVYNTVSCAVQIWRKKDGRLLVQVNAGDTDGMDTIQMFLTLFTMRKRSVLVEEVAGWLTPFMQAKLNQQSVSAPEENPIDVPSNKCRGCGAEIPGGESVCPYCGADSADAMEPSLTPASSAQSTKAQPLAQQGSAKSKSTFVLLGILLGGLGIHNFYAGCIGKGIAQLLITVLSGGSLAVVSWIWAIVEVCIVKQDARGIPFA